MVKRTVSSLDGDLTFQLGQINDLSERPTLEGEFTLDQDKEMGIITILLMGYCFFPSRTVALQCSPHELWSLEVGADLPAFRKVYLFSFLFFFSHSFGCWPEPKCAFSDAFCLLTLFLKSPPPHHLAAYLPCVWPPWLLKQLGLFLLPSPILLWTASEIYRLPPLKCFSFKNFT